MLNGQRILIENTPGLGDLLMLTPTLRRLKEMYPRCQLSVVSYGGNLSLVERLPYVDAAYGIWKGKLLGRFRPAAHFLGQDWCIFTTWNPQLAFFARLLGVPHRAGVCKPGREAENGFHYILPSDNWDAKDGEFKAAFLARQIFGALDIEADIDEVCDVSLPLEEERIRIKTLLAGKGCDPARGYVVIAPFANTERSLPMRLVEKAARYIHGQYGISSVLVHGVGVKELDELCGRLPKGIIYNLAGETTLMEMTALLQGARMVLATDSGPMHIACALGTATIAIFSSGNWRRYAPRKNCRVVTLDLPCSPCKRETAETCRTQECIKNITMNMLKNELDNCMQSSGRGYEW